MRLDKWLKVSRVIKRRPIANEICDQGRVTINGRIAKAGAEVKPGDKLEVRFGNRVLSLEIAQIPAGQVSTKMAPELYKVLGETSLRDFSTAVGDSETGEDE
jgi:ribosomal 50S subunit-recycling heat shock protein